MSDREGTIVAILRWATSPPKRATLDRMSDEQLAQAFDRAMDDVHDRRRGSRRQKPTPSTGQALTHAQVIEAAEEWIPCRYPGALVLVGTGSRRERPDAIAFVLHGPSVLLEAKSEWGDLVADETKPHRSFGGFGDVRWLAIPTSLGDPRRSDVAMRAFAGWGIVQFANKSAQSARVLCEPTARGDETTDALRLRHAQERDVLLRQLQEARADVQRLRGERAARLCGGTGRR